MATKTLTSSYLSRLTNANHDGVTQQICNRLQEAKVSNPMYAEAVKAVVEARQQEDDAYRRYSNKDFVSDDLRAADQLQDKYMTAVRGILRGILYLPETEPIYRKAQLAEQLFRDFQFSTHNGFEAEATKITNMVQQWKADKHYTLEELGISEWVDKADQQAKLVLNLIAQRVENESMKVKGEMAAARKVTDEAIERAYSLLNALNTFDPSTALTELMSLLFSIEDRARMYYLPGGKTEGGNPLPNPGDGTDSGDEGDGDGGDDEENDDAPPFGGD